MFLLAFFLPTRAPYLAFIQGGNESRAACLGILNSLPFDWQARRFVETHLNFFILEGLELPNCSDEDYSADCKGRGSVVLD